MKTHNSKLRNVLLALATAACTLTGALANEDAILNSDPIDINGYVKEAPATDHELETVKNELRKQKQAIQVNKEKGKKYKELSRTTEKLADVTEEMIDERKDSQETIERYNKKIDCLMQADPNDPDCDEYVRRKHDEVSVGQAGNQKVEAVAQRPGKMGDVIKILPYAGLSSINSVNEELEAGISSGLRVESDINERFSVGLGVSYMALKTLDFGNRSYSQYQNPSMRLGGREAEYDNLGFEIYSKYFLTKTERFRPYVGGGFSYNRTTMNYIGSYNQDVAYTGFYGNQHIDQYGDREIKSSHMKAQLVGGSEVVFTKSFGMNLELQYARGFGSNMSSDNNTASNYAYGSYGYSDQKRLQDLNDELIEANIFSVYAGMLVLF